MKTKHLFLAVAAGLACIGMSISFWGCSPMTAGSEVTNERVTVYAPDGSPSVGATVRFVPVNFIPGATAKTTATLVTSFSTTTNSKGQYDVPRLDDGMYNILIQKDSLAAIQDSVTIGKINNVSNDTLRAVGSITARVMVQPNDNPQIVSVQVLGTYRYLNVDTNGQFTIADLASGNYTLRCVTTQTDYTPGYQAITVRTGKHDTLQKPIQLIYTGIPIVTGLAATYDCVTGIAKITWNATSYRDFFSYIIYREDASQIEPWGYGYASSTTNSFSDTIFNPDSNSFSSTYQFRYRVCVQSNRDMAKGYTYGSVTITAVAPQTAKMLFAIDSIDRFAGQLCTLKVSPGVLYGKIVKYEWDIGNTGMFVRSAKADTTFLLSSVLNSDFRCVARVTDTAGTIGLDTIHIRSLISWEKVAQPLGTNLSNFTALEFNGKLWVFATTSNSYGAVAKYSAWSSANGTTWSKEVDTLPFKLATGKTNPIVFNNKLWVLNREVLYTGVIDTGIIYHDTIWQSGDGKAWTKSAFTAISNPQGHNAGYELWIVADNKLWLNYYSNRSNFSAVDSGFAYCWNTSTGNSWNVAPGAGYLTHWEYGAKVFTDCSRNDTIILVTSTEAGNLLMYLYNKAFQPLSSRTVPPSTEKLLNFNNTIWSFSGEIPNFRSDSTYFSSNLSDWTYAGSAFPGGYGNHDEIVFNNKIFSISNNGIWIMK